ncbi:MAG: S-methyl-5'-thioadenosine phosphorylase, partial [Chloroflexi bacterium]|nr:S-methyl-5'-thioadenosine phosphorylase [Chloroflexota bacterium]
ILQRNTELAQLAIALMAEQMEEWAVDMPAHQGMSDALITDKERIPQQAKEDLALIVGKYLG